MLCKIFIFALFVAVVIGEESAEETGEKTAEEAWPKYKEKYVKSYDEEEDAKRFAIFKEKYNEILEHNKKYKAGEVSWKIGLNKFTDWTPEELKDWGDLLIPDDQDM
ncbi:unnamed protein product [Diabrotica balteata]|uniref:Cathepsin propeptide inhibitor domain-containing protein n=1 Tax=Diabrotica balteata TaxID=107213 RepID=A0A9N9XHZ7_DIABA|nr:unnamed protein product [Diabrotica balteata]